MNTICKDLIPTNGVRITETVFPRGFYVARYDAQGFTSDNRWFSTLDKAEKYAASLKNNCR
jgi:hypothetical protein